MSDPFVVFIGYTIPFARYAQMRAWCVDRFGPERYLFPWNAGGTGGWMSNGCEFYFLQEHDAFEFKMRWG